MNYASDMIMGMDDFTKCYAEQYISCFVPKKHPDFYKLQICMIIIHLFQQIKSQFLSLLRYLIVCEVLNRGEGPIYNEIRGRGLAYDCNVSPQYIGGNLVLSLFESSDPVQALEKFYEILQKLKVPKEKNEILTTFNLESAKCSVLYSHFYNRSNPSSFSHYLLENSLHVNLLRPF